MKPSKPRTHIHRLPPCPPYDVTGTERWLAAMAQQGWLLVKDGFFAGVATFERAQPGQQTAGQPPARYRLEAAPQSTSMWAEDDGLPDPEAVELNRKYAWEYLGNRGEFYIYRTFQPDARELHTDPAVQALALDAVRKRRRGAFLSILFWLVVYPVLFFRLEPLLSIVNMRTWFFLFSSLLVLWLAGGALAEALSLRRLRNRLLYGEAPRPAAHPRRRAALHHIGRAAQILLVAVWICIALHRWGLSLTQDDKTALEDYAGTPPFATIADFAGGGAHGYQATMPGKSFQSVQEWSDWLAPRNIRWAEHARVTRAGGSVLDGGLYIDYHLAASPSLARELAQEYCRQDSRQGGCEPLALPPLDVDFAAAYQNQLHFPTVVFQKGAVAVRATFYQTSGSPVAFAEWAGMVATSVAAP